MNVLLIYPPDRQDQKSMCPPVGLACIASVLIDNGHSVSILEINAHRYSNDQVLRILKNYLPKPDIIGIGGIVTTYKYVKWLTKEIKQIMPETPLVIGGSVGSSIPELIFKNTPVDLIVNKEGEITMLEIVEKVKNGQNDFKNIPGVIYRHENSCKFSEPRVQIKNLDQLPLPAYHLLPMEIYIKNIEDLAFYKNVMDVSAENRHMMLIASRGCTGRCSFCYRQFPQVSLNSPEHIYNHILHLHSLYGINRITFMDELFILTRQRAIELAEKLKKLNQSIGLLYRISSARVDSIDEELLHILKDSGCRNIVYGLESGSQKMLDGMKKRTSVKQNLEAVLLTHKVGLHTIPQFVIGLPGENKQTIEETLDFVRKVDFWDGLGFHLANPYPGTDIYNCAKEKGLITNEDAFVENIAGTDSYPVPLAEIQQNEMKLILKKFNLERQIRKTISDHGYFKGSMCLFIHYFKKVFKVIFKKF